MIIEPITEEHYIDLMEEAVDVYEIVTSAVSGSENAAVIMGLTEVLIDTIQYQPEHIQMSTRLEIIRVLLEEAQANSVESVN